MNNYFSKKNVIVTGGNSGSGLAISKTFLKMGSNVIRVDKKFDNSYYYESDSDSKLLNFDMQSYLPADILTKVDRASMLTSLEVRSPLLNHKLIEYMLGIPYKYKVSPFQNKIIYKELVHSHIPKNLIERKKEGFGIPMHILLKTTLKDWLFDMLCEKNLDLHGYFNKSYINQIVYEHVNDINNHSYKIWYILMFQKFFLNYKYAKN